MKKIFYSILAAAAIVASCVKEPINEPVSPSGDGSSVFTGTIIQPGGIDEVTKVSIIGQTSEAVYITWTSGDQIYIIKNNSGEEWNSPTESTKPKVFSAASSEATTQFTGTPPTDWIAPGQTYAARYYGKNDVWEEYVLACDAVTSGNPVNGIHINCNSHAEAAFLENMPLYCEASTYDSGNFRYNFKFSNAYAILQINVPSKLVFEDLYVCVNTQNVEFESGQLKDGSKYTLCLEGADAVKSTDKYKNKDYVAYFVPVTAGSYDKLTIVAAKDNAEVARMETYVGNVKNTSDSKYVLPELESNNIYPFDFCNTKTISQSNTSTEPCALVSSNGIDFKVNVSADITGDVYITTPVEGSEPANIYLNLRGHEIGNLYLNGQKSHVEGENGTIVSAEAQTSNSTFVVKPSLTITGLTVKKGSVKVEGTEDKKANVTTITIPSEVTEQIKIDVSGVSTSTKSERVKIVNNSETPVVVVPDNVADQKSYQVEEGAVTPVSKKTVAKIGNAEYETLAAAISEATAGQTITLVSNIALDKEITISKGITIDGNNFTIAVSDDEYWNQYKIGGDNQGLGKVNMITVKADNFTLKNVTLDGKDCRGVSLCTTKGGKDILYQNITYTGRGSGHYYGEANGLVTFDRCKFDIHGYAVHFGGESSLDDDVVIKKCELNGWSSFGKCKSLTITDSHLGGANDEGKNGWFATLRPYCPTTITKCTFSDMYIAEYPQEGYYLVGLGTGAATTVILNDCKIVNDAKQEITGADICSIVRKDAFGGEAAYNGSVFAFDATGDATDGYTAGTFYAVDPEKIKLQSGYEYYAIEGKTNIYGVREGQSTDVAKIDNTGYPTLAAAIEAVGEGKTITLVKDVDKAAGISVASGKNFTVDFGEHTYAMECPGAGSAATQTAGFQLLKNSTITFKNGTIKCTEANKEKTWGKTDASKGIALMIQNYANLTLEDMTIDATNIAHNGAAVRYALSNNSGNVEYKGVTSIISAAGDYAFDVCKYDTYEAPTVTWNSTGTVNGGIELSGGKFVVAKNLAVSVPVMAVEGESILEIGTGATLSAADNFADPNPNITIKLSTAPVQVKQGAALTINGEGTVGGTKTYSAVVVAIGGDNDTKTAKLTVDGNVTLQGDYYGIAGNGNRHNTDITVKGGTIKGLHANDNLGIYQPQNGKLTISGGNIEGYASAVEVRGGTVEISGGELKSTATSFSCNANGSGSTTVGAALAIAQHNTKKDITVTITGGTFTGVKALNESNPQANDPAPQVTLSVSGGTFNGEVSTVDVTGFITGGTFNTKPADNLIATGYAATENSGVWTVAEAATGIANQEEFVAACAAAKSGDKLVLGNGEFAIGPVDIDGKTLTFKGQGAANTKIYIGNGGYDGNGGHGSNKTANMTFEDVTLDDLASDSGYLTGFTEAAGLTFRNVTFAVGFSNWGNKGGDVSFYNCTFNQSVDGKYNVQELRSANNTHYLFDGCTFNSTPGRFINAYKQGGESNFIEIIVKNCSFSGTTQSKAALNLKSDSNGCSINCYFLGRNTVNNVKVQHAATESALFADEEGTCAKVYVGASKETAVLIWENQAKTSNYTKPEDFNPES